MRYRLFALIVLMFGLSFALFAQDEKPKEPEELAAAEAERLEKLLNLEPHQTFYVDSLLQHDWRAMKNEMDVLQKSGKQEYSSYKAVQDRYNEQIEKGLQAIFTEEQWIAYQKSTGKWKKDKKSKKGKKKNQ